MLQLAKNTHTLTTSKEEIKSQVRSKDSMKYIFATVLALIVLVSGEVVIKLEQSDTNHVTQGDIDFTAYYANLGITSCGNIQTNDWKNPIEGCLKGGEK